MAKAQGKQNAQSGISRRDRGAGHKRGFSLCIHNPGVPFPLKQKPCCLSGAGWEKIWILLFSLSLLASPPIQDGKAVLNYDKRSVRQSSNDDAIRFKDFR